MKVRYYGHIGLGTGYAVAAEQTCKAILAAGLELEIRPLKAPGREPVRTPRLDSLVPYIHDESSQTDRPDAIVVHTLPMDCERVLEIEGLWMQGTAGRFIAHTVWEGTSAMPHAMRETLAHFDQVWTPSSLTAMSMMHPDGAPVHRVPHPFDPDQPAPTMGRWKKTDERFAFYYVGAWNARKNPEGLIRAFAHAFTSADRVELLLRTDVDDLTFLAALASTGIPQDDLPRIERIDRLSDNDMGALHRVGDVFVTATRSEGWNLPAFDAMLARRHIISPFDLGSDDFLEHPEPEATRRARSQGVIEGAATSASLVRSRKAPAYSDVSHVGEKGFRVTSGQGLSSRGLWNEPSLDELAEKMRLAYRSRVSHLAVRYSPADLFSYEAVGKTILATLETP